MPSFIDQFIELTKKKRELEKELQGVQARLTMLEPRVLDDMAERSQQSIKFADGTTVYLNREVFASLEEDKDAAIAALKECGYGDLVKEGVHHQTLRAWIKEQGEVPEELKDHIKVTEIYRVRMRS